MAHRERKFYDSALAIELYDSAVSSVLSLCSRNRYRRREERGRGGFLHHDGHSEQQAAARQLYEEIFFHQGRFGPFGGTAMVSRIMAEAQAGANKFDVAVGISPS